jgi:hypothetical protein
MSQDSYTITPDNPTIVMDDFVTLYQGGKLVGQLGVTVDFSKCPSEYAQLMFNVLRPMRIGMPTFEQMEEDSRRLEEMKEQRRNVWYRRFGRWLKGKKNGKEQQG